MSKVKIEVWPVKICVSVEGYSRQLWFYDWIMILKSGIIRPEDKIVVYYIGKVF